MLNRLGFVDKEKVWDWVKKFDSEMEPDTWNDKPVQGGRKKIWFGVGVNLGLQNIPYKSREIDPGLRAVGNKWYGSDDWNSALLLKYEPGMELKPHTDRNVFDSKVVLINVSQDGLFGGTVEFIYGRKIEMLSNGEVISFNNQNLHGIRPVFSERWSLSFRKVLCSPAITGQGKTNILTERFQ